MGYPLYREVKRYAPDDLDTGELALLLILADEANDETRECFPGMEELSTYMRMSADGVGRILQRLAARGIEVRVPFGKDKTGRVVYARKGVRTTYVIPRFGPLDSDANGRTTVRPKGIQRSDAGPANDPLSPDAGPAKTADRPDASPSMAGPQSGPSPQFPHEEDPHLLPHQRIIRAAGLGLSDDEEKRFIEWTKNTYKPRSSGWWHKVATEGDLPGLVAEWRAAQAPGTGSGDFVMPPHCGVCHPKTRMIEDPETDLPLGRCPECHPGMVEEPRQRPSATARAFAEADAAGEEAKRILANGGAGGYKPYQNPKDQSVYLDPIS